MYFKHTPSILKPLAKDLVFDLPNDRNAIYVTFDDGPHPEITPQVLELLERFDAKATFFLIGEHAEKYPEIVETILSKGHSIGFHGHTHLSGWKTKDDEYLKDVLQSAEIVSSPLFRPPYGQITLSQSKALKKDFRIIMWSDLSADFDESYSIEQCVDFATKKIESGSIIVFHDSEKAHARMIPALERCLEIYQEKEFRMEAIPMDS